MKASKSQVYIGLVAIAFMFLVAGCSPSETQPPPAPPAPTTTATEAPAAPAPEAAPAQPAPAATEAPAPAPAAATASTFPVGLFERNDWTWEFRADGTYTSKNSAANETGAYTVTDNQIVITGARCGDAKGTYSWTLENDTLTFKVVDDECADRQSVITAGQWRKKS